MEEQFDKDFDRLFARDLQSAGSREQARGEDWAALSARLDVAAAPGYRRYLPWLLLLLLLLSNGWWAWYRTNPASTRAAEHSWHADTVRQTVVLYDTIHRTVTVDRLSPVKKIKTERFAATDAIKSEFSAPALPKASITQRPTKALLPVAQISVTIPESQTITAPTNGHPGASRQIEPAAAPAVTTPSDSASAPIEEAKDTRTPALTNPDPEKTQSGAQSPDSLLQIQAAAPPPSPIKRHRYPSSWLLGLGGGVPMTFVTDDLALEEAKVAQFLLMYRFSRHWSATASVFWQGYNYEQEHHFGPYPGFDLPPAPGQGYILNHIESEAVDILPGVSMQYHLWPEHQCSAYLGAGYALHLRYLEDTRLEYEETATGALYRQELPEHIRAYGSAVSLQGGVNWLIRPRWTLWGGFQGWGEPGHWRRATPAVSLLAGVKFRIK